VEVLRTDVAIIGGGLGACPAALAVVRFGRVILPEETHWIGGHERPHFFTELFLNLKAMRAYRAPTLACA
jgi:hypothetical protein